MTTTTNSDRAIQATFARLARENQNLTDLDSRIINAFERLMLGQPQLTDGRTSVTNICVEAGVSRASYYRSPIAAAIKEILAAPQVQRPEAEELRAQITGLKQAQRKASAEHAAQLRDYRNTVTTYANQIQLLTLANAELREENNQLQRQAAQHTNLRVLDQGAPAAGAS
jgi:hypothetical protein